MDHNSLVKVKSCKHKCNIIDEIAGQSQHSSVTK